MLKSLLSKIKSEKSSEAHSTNSHAKNETKMTLHQEKLEGVYQQLRENTQIHSDIPMVRYKVFQGCPNIYNSVLACPISVFNLLPYAKRKVKEIDLTKDPLPPYMAPLQSLLSQELPSFNHLLINVYPPGVGIMPHFDGPLYQPKVVVLSLGGPAIINFADSYNNINKVARLLLEDQSIHIFQAEAYEKYLHGIQNYTVDSIFLKVDFSPTPLIVTSSVANFHLTRLHKAVLDRVGKTAVEGDWEMDLSEEAKCRCSLMRISQNDEYNFKIEIRREERISITIRNKLG